MSRVALCVDHMSFQEPALIGLQGENLGAQQWLDVYTSGEAVRQAIAQAPEASEVWIAGCEGIEAINLAASLKKDRPQLRVCLLAGADNGSLLSRAYAASLDAVYTQTMFVRRYAAAKAALAFSEEGRLPGEKQNRLEAGASSPLPNGSLGAAACLEREENAALATSLQRAAAVSTLAAQRSAFVLSVVSASGGAGKSTVAALAALCTQLRGLSTVLVDLDFQFGNVAGFFKEAKATPVESLLVDGFDVEGLKQKGSFPAIVAPPVNPDEAELFEGKAAQVIEKLAAAFDVVVLNTGAAWTGTHAVLFERSSKVLFLVDQRASSLQACHRAIKLCERCGMALGPVLFVANRCAKGSLLTSIDVSCALHGARTSELKEGGRDVEDYSAAGILIDLVTASNPLYTSLEDLLSSFVPGFNDAVASGGDVRERRGKKLTLFKWRDES